MKPRHLLPAAALCVLALAGCGNKGPLVRPSDVPPPAEAMPVMPDTTPPAEPPVTDVVAPPPTPANGD